MKSVFGEIVITSSIMKMYIILQIKDAFYAPHFFLHTIDRFALKIFFYIRLFNEVTKEEIMEEIKTRSLAQANHVITAKNKLTIRKRCLLRIVIT